MKVSEIVTFLQCVIYSVPGCFNKELWNPEPSFGKLWTEEDFQELLMNASKPYISGITLLGGDPFHPVNRGNLRSL